MKITKTRAQAEEEAALRAKANEGCGICPECGEDWPSRELFMEAPPRCDEGIELSYTRTYVSTDRGHRYWAVDCYRCKTCGAEWESEPYPTDKNR